MSLAAIAHINPSSVLDCGANVGGFYREAKVIWPEAKFWLIEGNQACQPYLEATGADYTIAYLGNRRRTVDFYKRKGGGTDTGNSYYRELTPFFSDEQTEVETVQLVPLDELTEGQFFDLIKLDVQGAELDVIRGGPVTLSRAQHVLMEVAFAPYNQGAPLAEEVITYMDGIGFSNQQFIGDICHPLTREVVQRDVLFSR